MKVGKCTKENPFSKERKKSEGVDRWEHDRVIEVGDQESQIFGGDVVTKQCKNCGIQWKEELPQ